MIDRKTLVDYLDSYLHIGEIADYGPQGLQLEAENDVIRRIALAVDVSPAIIETAASWQADMLLVHHGILWRDVEPIAGPLGERVRLLLQNDMNLYAAHLSLDAHPEVGNNAELARLLGVDVADRWCEAKGTKIGVVGRVTAVTTRDQFADTLETQLHTRVRMLPHGPEQVQTVAIISGFGADRVADAKAVGADTFVTGETSHAHYWAAADYGINVIYGGHYATETVGVKALGRRLTEKYGIEAKFFDFPTKM